MMTMKKCAFAAAALATLMGQAWASDAEGEFHGYFRTGAGSNSAKGSQACYSLPGAGDYRLGNECTTYGELAYSKEVAKAANGASFVATVRTVFQDGVGVSDSDKSFRLGEVFMEAKKLDFLNSATLWVGKRFYDRPDIHIIDYKYIHGDGIGGGVQSIPAGPGKFSYALMRNNNDKNADATRHIFSYEDVPANADATLKFDLTLISADSSVADSHNGWSLSALHKQNKVLGGDNVFGVQYGVGPGIKIGGTDSLGFGSDVTRTRVFDNLYWQVTPEFGGSALVLVQRDKSNAGSQTWTSVGARPVYALTDNFKLQLEVGHDRITSASGGAAQQLSKVTFAPTVALAKNFWSRPELRLFVTYAKWNTAAQQAAAAGSTLSSTGVFGGKTNGTSAGVQVEAWF
ncbi:carbohydrate porin [Janthinobacterium sp.]|uniref:maltoporin n=1 Tax=Janthinobacterium sp. TaxID=1871054 RepID=UPI00293D9123|nr:carbohydrate porin [Janthinobacterium sp.]